MEPKASDLRCRVAIEAVQPTVDGGRFPLKRIVGDDVTLSADIFADGHDLVAARLWLKAPHDADFRELALHAEGNDRWMYRLALEQIGRYEFQIEGWTDRFSTWIYDLKKRLAARQEVKVDLLIGAGMIGETIPRARPADVPLLRAWQQQLSECPDASAKLDDNALDELSELVGQYPDRRWASRSAVAAIVVDRERARFSSWYECFPRSCSPEPGKHGTFRDLIARLPYIASMGFDVVYLPPIHPIGRTFRKGPNNSLTPSPSDPGVPWAIGSSEGGHLAIHPELGTLHDFRDLLTAAASHSMEIALDIAFQCSPDHPYVKEHPNWFRARPDGTIQYAENPPKKYQDIYPFDFESDDAQGLWQELTEVFLYWCEQGVRIFRVDNPHTKSLAFWESAITQVKAAYPDTLFLSEAFTRPKIMYRLAKLGFSQSYTYFTWRYSKQDFLEYLTELNGAPVRDYFRPNFWPNTPDILPEHLQTGGRAAFIARLVLAATLSSNFGIYGPVYELLEHLPRDPGSEEYLDSEKYEVRHWNLDQPTSLRGIIAAVNRARREHPALQRMEGLQFHQTDNDQILCYSKRSADGRDRVLVVVNLNWHLPQHGFVYLDLAGLGLPERGPYTIHDLLNGGSYKWEGARNFVELDPSVRPAHVLVVEN